MMTYGNTACATCGGAHAAAEWIQESSQSRFRLMQLMMKMRLEPAALAANNAANQAPRMFGILLTPNRNYAAHSGQTNNLATPFLAKAQGLGYTLCQERTANGGTHYSQGGYQVSAHSYSNALRPGGYPPGCCAAPRLIEQALEDHRANGWPINLTQWHMSEVMYQPNTVGNWTHGLTAPSCATCQALVPLLLCPGPADPFAALGNPYG